MLLLSIAMIVSSAAESTPARVTSSEPGYFADRMGVPIKPLTGPIDLSDSEFMGVQTLDGVLQIYYRDIRSLSYSPTAVSASQPGSAIFHRLLTIGFDAANGVHHNLVVQLDPKRRHETLKTIVSRTGLKMGDAPRKQSANSANR
jgi:hypothetical protein